MKTISEVLQQTKNKFTGAENLHLYVGKTIIIKNAEIIDTRHGLSALIYAETENDHKKLKLYTFSTIVIEQLQTATNYLQTEGAVKATVIKPNDKKYLLLV